MKRLIIILLGITALLVAVFFAFNSYIYQQKQSSVEVAEVKPYRATLTGQYICLPHTDPNGPQTMECAFGINTTTGEYYVLKFDLISQEQSEINLNEHFTASGVITPIELLSTEGWGRYPVKGVFSVTDSVQKLNL